MTENAQASQSPTPEEVLEQVEQATAALEKQIAKARKQFAQCVQMAEVRLAYAEARLAEARTMREQLEPYADDPEGARHLADVQALGTVYGATRRMLEIELECYRHNLASLEMNLKRPPTDFALKVPAEQLAYQEARIYMDVHMAILQVTAFLDGVDTVLRATSGEPAVVPSSDEELIERRSRASTLRAAVKANPELEVLVTQVSNELQETLALLDWGKGALAKLETLPPIAQRGVLEDADWARLNGCVVYLRGLPARVADHPELAGLFPAAQVEALPYEAVDVSRTTGTGRLGTGHLGTGPLTA